MFRSSGSQLVLGLGLAGYAAVVLLPIAFLIAAAVALVVSPTEGPTSAVMALSARQLGLLIRTVLFAGSVSAATVVVGVLAAGVLWQWTKSPGVWLRWLVLPLITIPPFVHAGAWINAFQAGGDLLNRFHLNAPQLGGWTGAGFVEVMAYLPVTTGLALLGLASVSPSLVNAARIQHGSTAVFFRVVLPLAAPQIIAGGCVVFILSLADYSIPSVFQQNVYALELFVQYSQLGSPGLAFVSAIPLLAIAVAVSFWAMGGLRRAAMRPVFVPSSQGSQLSWAPWLRRLQLVAVAVLAAQILVPLISLLHGTASLDRLQASVAAAHHELSTSLAVALITALCCLPLALALASQLARPGKPSLFWWVIAILPLAVPAPLVGIGLISAWNNPVLGAAYGTLAMPVLASLTRFTPFAALLLLAYLKRMDPGLLDAARVFQRSRIHGWLAVNLHLLAPGLIAAGCVAAALSIGELGATLLVAPPGRATLTMRIYNYMHYGSSASVAGLCLVMTTVIVLLAALTAWGFHSWTAPRKQPAAER